MFRIHSNDSICFILIHLIYIKILTIQDFKFYLRSKFVFKKSTVLVMKLVLRFISTKEEVT